MDRCPTHPGEILKEDVIPSLQMTSSELALFLDISTEQLNSIIFEKKPISDKVANRLGELCGNGSAVWIKMQAQHDAWNKLSRD